MTGLDLAGKRVLIREDLNVPVNDGKVSSDKRIKASLPTIKHAMNVIVHLIIKLCGIMHMKLFGNLNNG